MAGHAAAQDLAGRALGVQNVLADGAFREQLLSDAREERTQAHAELPAELRELAAGLGDSLDFTNAVADFHALAAMATLAGGPVTNGWEPDLAAALAFLEETAPWPQSWEVRRWDIDGAPLAPPLVGQWFVRGLMLQALHEMGRDQREPFRALLDEIPPGELRYYGPWRGIPPDADDLGLMLQLARLLDDPPEEKIETWLAVMAANLAPDGVVPIWFPLGPDGRENTPPDILWKGGDCSAVRMCILQGLVRYAPERFETLLRANAESVGRCWNGRAFDGVFHYPAAFVPLAFCRLVKDWSAVQVARSSFHRFAAIRDEMLAELERTQRLDGGWGSPQRTAFHAEAYATSCRDELVLRRAMRYLIDHQRQDGSWRAEPLYVIPGKTGEDTRHEGRELTTVFCARALYVCAEALGLTS